MEDRFYSITVNKDDQPKADAIMQRHRANGNIECYYVEGHFDRDSRKVVYWVKPYISDDLDIIEDDLRQNGIKLF